MPFRFVPPLCAVALALASPALLAQTEEDDPLGRLLVERGWVGSGSEVAKPRLAAANPARRTGAPRPTSPASPGLVRKARDRAADLVSAAIGLMGAPYLRGGNSVDTGFDCSGFTRHVFEISLGLVLPRTSREQARANGFLDVPREDLRPGDLVFFNTVRSAFSHVGIYLGNHKFIHAPRTGGVIRVEDLRVNYWTQRFDGARRAAKIADPATLAAAAAAAAASATTTTASADLPAAAAPGNPFIPVAAVPASAALLPTTSRP